MLGSGSAEAAESFSGSAGLASCVSEVLLSASVELLGVAPLLVPGSVELVFDLDGVSFASVSLFSGFALCSGLFSELVLLLFFGVSAVSAAHKKSPCQDTVTVMVSLAQ